MGLTCSSFSSCYYCRDEVELSRTSGRSNDSQANAAVPQRNTGTSSRISFVTQAPTPSRIFLQADEPLPHNAQHSSNRQDNFIQTTPPSIRHYNVLQSRDASDRHTVVQNVNKSILKKPFIEEMFSHYQQEISTFSTSSFTEELREGTPEFMLIKNKFMSTTQRHFRVLQIKKVHNMFLKMLYLMKKEEYEITYGINNVNEIILFHGSTVENIEDICLNNFNWRLYKPQCRFGQGVNFSKISNYASNYCDNTKVRVMIAAKVLHCVSCQGNRQMHIPSLLPGSKTTRYDSSEKPSSGQAVLVKYHDDEFYPEYVIIFTGQAMKSR